MYMHDASIDSLRYSSPMAFELRENRNLSRILFLFLSLYPIVRGENIFFTILYINGFSRLFKLAECFLYYLPIPKNVSVSRQIVQLVQV